jgi:hypothetical protein
MLRFYLFSLAISAKCYYHSPNHAENTIQYPRFVLSHFSSFIILPTPQRFNLMIHVLNALLTHPSLAPFSSRSSAEGSVAPLRLTAFSFIYYSANASTFQSNDPYLILCGLPREIILSRPHFPAQLAVL